MRFSSGCFDPTEAAKFAQAICEKYSRGQVARWIMELQAVPQLARTSSARIRL